MRKYNDYIYHAVREWFRWNANQYISVENIDKMSRAKVLECFLEWEGIYGYTTYIKQIANL